MKTIVVASANPVKINATQLAFSRIFPAQHWNTIGTDVASGVSEQPIGDEETLKGAINRAHNAQKEFPRAAFWVGIEGGIMHDEAGTNVFAWVYTIAADGKKSRSKTSTFYLPKPIIELLNQGVELGDADDQVFGQQDSKRGGGSVGLLTHGVLDRTHYYEQAVILALIPYLNEDYYF